MILHQVLMGRSLQICLLSTCLVVFVPSARFFTIPVEDRVSSSDSAIEDVDFSVSLMVDEENRTSPNNGSNTALSNDLTPDIKEDGDTTSPVMESYRDFLLSFPINRKMSPRFERQKSEGDLTQFNSPAVISTVTGVVLGVLTVLLFCFIIYSNLQRGRKPSSRQPDIQQNQSAIDHQTSTNVSSEESTSNDNLTTPTDVK